MRVLPLLFPGLVILDGGADNKDCDSVIAGVMALAPRVGQEPAGASSCCRTAPADPKACRSAARVDAVVAKPFTTEQLQPVVDRLLQKARAPEAQSASGELSSRPLPFLRARPAIVGKSATSFGD